MPNGDKLCTIHSQQLKHIEDDVAEIKTDVKSLLKSTGNIPWLVWGVRGLYSALIVGVGSWIIKTIFF